MCGLVGFVGLERRSEEYELQIKRMLNAIDHRGPDELGIYLDDRAALGLARLALIDLPLGKQPMSFAHGRYWLVFNGTIFNYLEIRAELESIGVRFLTNSDTEVLGEALLRWQADALPHLNGGFAFAWYDVRQGSVLLGRDLAGERPLFYALQEGGLGFASEIKGLFALSGVRRAFSRRGISHTFKVGCPLDPTTCFEGVHALPPGCFGTYEGGEFRLGRHSVLPFPARPAEIASLSFAAAKEVVRETVRESVRVRLRGDFKVSAALSGGIDSAIVAALAGEELGRPLRTFSLVMPGSPLDEASAQEHVARYLRSEHSSVELNDQSVRSLFPAAVYHAETPLFRPSAVAVMQLAQLVHAEGFRATLVGHGADEVFCGYDIAKEAAFLENFNRFVDDEQRIRWLSDLFHDERLTRPFVASDVCAAYAEPHVRSSPLGAHYRRFAREPDMSSLVRYESTDTNGWAQMIVDGLTSLDENLLSRPAVERSRAIDWFTVCGGWGLGAFGDRASTPAGVELRAPFLDRSVLDCGWNLPLDFTLGNGRREKHILREAFADLLPNLVIDRPKQGLRGVSSTALRPLQQGDWVEDVVERAVTGRSELIDPLKARTLMAKVLDEDVMISHPDTNAYCLMLSTVLLEDQFGAGFSVHTHEPKRKLAKMVDRRGADRAIPFR